MASPSDCSHGAPWAQSWIKDELDKVEHIQTPQRHINAQTLRRDRVEELERMARYLAPRLLIAVVVIAAVLAVRSYGGDIASGSVIIEYIRKGF